MYRIDRSYAHRKLMRAGAKIVYHRPPREYAGIPHWVLLIHDDCENGDGGVVYHFVRKRRKWQCYGFGRLRYCGELERLTFADKLPNHPPVQVERRDGKWWLVNKKTGDVIREYLPTPTVPNRFTKELAMTDDVWLLETCIGGEFNTVPWRATRDAGPYLKLLRDGCDEKAIAAYFGIDIDEDDEAWLYGPYPLDEMPTLLPPKA
jgi:hypothetical protein